MKTDNVLFFVSLNVILELACTSAAFLDVVWFYEVVIFLFLLGILHVLEFSYTLWTIGWPQWSKCFQNFEEAWNNIEDL